MRHQSSAFFSLFWAFDHLPLNLRIDTLIYSAIKWLLISSQDVTLASICDTSAAANATAATVASSSAGPCTLCARYTPRSLSVPQLSANTELVLGNKAHLHALLGTCDADHMFAVEQEEVVVEEVPAPGTPVTAETTPSSAAATAEEAESCNFASLIEALSMAWAFRAFSSQAKRRSKTRMSVVTRRQRRCTPRASPGEPRVWPSGPCPAWSTHPAPLVCMAHGLSRTLFMEDKSLYGPAMDLAPGASSSGKLTPAQLAWVAQGSNEYSCAVRGAQIYAERLVAEHSAPRRRRGRTRQQDRAAATVLSTAVVSGGTKGLGLECARQLAGSAVGALVLTSRSGLLTKEQLIEISGSASSSASTAIFVAYRDASRPIHSAQLAAWLHEQLPAVQTYVHAAGVLGFDLLPDLSSQEFASLLAPKASCVHNLFIFFILYLCHDVLPSDLTPLPLVAGTGRTNVYSSSYTSGAHAIFLLHCLCLEPGAMLIATLRCILLLGCLPSAGIGQAHRVNPCTLPACHTHLRPALATTRPPTLIWMPWPRRGRLPACLPLRCLLDHLRTRAWRRSSPPRWRL